jgi:hypothetical protein
MQNDAFWDVAPCGFIINRRSEGMCRLHLQGSYRITLISSTLKMEAIHSFETSFIINPHGAHPRKRYSFTKLLMNLRIVNSDI